MSFLIFIFSIFMLLNSIYCSNFRIFSEKNQQPESNSSGNSNEVILANPNATESDGAGFLHDGLVTRQMEDILIQEKPVLLNTIPHTALNHILFVNSSGLFTNITVVLTTTVPIAVISQENDSIHRILSRSASNETLEILKTDFDKVNGQISESISTLPTEILDVVERTVQTLKESSFSAPNAELEDKSVSNSTDSESSQQSN
ncbi:putative signal peptide-containing protein [Cryptosporidium canis]|uniref:Signal peptide-containing protein n=1 Tax=Cryptosporidium canis TaxID=195482 RepID=A0ABQ8P5H3_9CRYT|nr:putative signal peptide-containing protein [Cryptosporidium canis]KAJ1613461.1 putative signal peptide-containing protein [Cryptosporidium canis]